jgi:hypothetical protein
VQKLHVNIWRSLSIITLASWLILAIVHQISETADIVMSIITFISLFACWVGAIYIWCQINARTASHIIALIFLLPFGFLWGWVYILFACRDVPIRTHL